MSVKPFAHQAISIAHNDTTPIVFDVSDPGCVSADTEYLTPTGWKRFDSYMPGDLVAQFYPESREIEFVTPLQYVKRPCAQMIAIAPSRGTSQRLSPEHRVLYYSRDGSHGVCSAVEFMAHLQENGPHRSDRRFCTTFSVKNDTEIQLNDAEIRVQVAVIADGHFPTDSNRCVIRIKKYRKIVRLISLLKAADIEYREKVCGSDPEFLVYTFHAPTHDKQFTKHWWQASQAQLEVIADELPHWDSAISPRPSSGIRFSSFIEESAQFAQYAFAAAKHPTYLNFSVRDRRAEGRGVMIEYTVHARAVDVMVGPGRADSVFPVANPEGFKYCFEVPTSFLLLRHNGYIFATGNTGKGYVRIMGFAKRRAAGGGAMLVFAPRSLLRTVWVNDIAKFAPHLTVSVANADNRDEAFAAEADVYITNIDAAIRVAERKPAFFKRFSELVIDESTAFKHHTSRRSKAILKISQYFSHRCCMTGTPNGNSIVDVWHQVMILDGGKRLGNSFYKFREAVCTPQQVGRNVNAMKWTDRDGAEEAVFGLLSDIVIRHKFEDCTDIPANHIYSVDYDLTPKQMRAYFEMEQTQMLTLKNSAQSVLAINAAAVATKLLQISSGAVYDGVGGYVTVDTARYEMILDLVEQRKHSLAFFFWKHQRDALLKEAVKRGVTHAVIDGNTSDKEREEIVRGYQAGVYQVLFAHPKSAAHGLTLTKGTATIWSSPTYDLEIFKQGSKRQHRIGQTAKTETIVCIAKGTIEEKVYALMTEKDKRMTTLLDLFGTLTPAVPVKKATKKKVMGVV